MNFKYCLPKIGFFLILFNSCTGIKTYNSLNIDRQFSFIDEEIIVKTKKKNCSKISIISDNSGIKVGEDTKCFYKISSLNKSSGNIIIKLNRKNKPNLLKKTIVNFYEHGTKDFNLV